MVYYFRTMSKLISEVTNEDCMVMMSRYPDKYFELACIDPPYGIGVDGQKKIVCNNPKHNRKEHDFKNWDNEIPDENYFNELKRVSVNQIIWGGNYYTEHLAPTKAWIFWYKGQRDLTMSDGEMAWTSFDKVTRQFELNRTHLGSTIHPTQKPVALYSWIFEKYAKQGDKILDTHLGSQSSRIAAHKAGLDFWGTELDKDYFESGNKRFNKYLGLDGMFSEEHF